MGAYQILLVKLGGAVEWGEQQVKAIIANREASIDAMKDGRLDAQEATDVEREFGHDQQD